ncbi:MAG: peroxiredoxin family protein [Proteobacteria bacterium]|nr:peroxiredoxin family protein [Pseudomonadota bacterium]
MAELKKNHASYGKFNTRVFALSVDPLKQSQNLVKKMDLPFPLLCDEDKHVIDLFHLRNPFEHGGIAYPATFIINPERKICYRSLDGTASRVDLSDELLFLEKIHNDAGYQMDIAPKKSWIIPSLKDGWRMSLNLIFNGNFADWKHFLLFPVEMFRMMVNKFRKR